MSASNYAILSRVVGICAFLLLTFTMNSYAQTTGSTTEPGVKAETSNPSLMVMVDSDGDGIDDAVDNCPNIPNPTQIDMDLDGVGNKCDNCPRRQNNNQNDGDGDGVGDVCDVCPTDSNDNGLDTDKDTVGDDCDNCPGIKNKKQGDKDGDGVGNQCDNCPLTPNPGQEDADGNGIGDACEGPLLELDENSLMKILENDPELSFQVSPNPAQDLVRIRTAGLLGQSVELRLSNQTGQVIWQQSIEKVENKEQVLNLKELGIHAGYYYVECFTTFGRLVEAVVVQ